MGDAVKPETLRSAIASAVAELKAYEVPAECVRLGLAPGDEGEAFGSKFRYVLKRLRPLAVPELTAVARKVVDEYDVPELEQILASLGMTGVDGEFKNLIFAANGPKPDIVLRDAVSNRLEIVRNAEYCLRYTRPLDAAGLSWAALVDWWQRTHPTGQKEPSASQALCARLAESLASPPEKVLFHTYAALYFRDGGHALPALIPQVYLHYDPYTAKRRAEPGPSRSAAHGLPPVAAEPSARGPGGRWPTALDARRGVCWCGGLLLVWGVVVWLRGGVRGSVVGCGVGELGLLVVCGGGLVCCGWF